MVANKIIALDVQGRPAHVGFALLLAAMTLVAYVPAMGGGFIWDDDDYVQHNPTLRTVDGLGQIWFQLGATRQYYPMVHTSYWIEYRLWGLDPTGFHVVNVLLHALSAVLLWRVLTLLGVPGAWGAAAIFALHPVHVESVAWITERKNVLSGTFYIGAAWAYLRYALGREEEAAGSRGHYIAALALFAAALFSKTVACSLPAALLLVLWWKRGRIGREEAVALAPFFVLGAVLAGVTIWMEEHSVGAWGEHWDLNFIERCLIAGRALWFYAGKLCMPVGLTFIYPRWQIDAADWSQYVFPIGAGVAVMSLWFFRQRLGRGPLVAVLFFVGTLSPALGFFNIYPMLYSFVADHFQYLASLGLIVLAVAVGWEAARRFGSGGQTAAIGMLVAVLAICGALTWRQGYTYANLETLWRDTLAKNADAWIAHNNLANVLKARGQLDEAVRHYRRVLLIEPGFARVYVNLGETLMAMGAPDAALKVYRRALEVDPDYAKAHIDLGNALLARKDEEGAISHYRRALELAPDAAEAHINLGTALAGRGDVENAILHYRRALELEPNFAEAHNNLGKMLLAQKDVENAISHYRRAVELKPDYTKAHYNLGMVLRSLGREEEARRHLRSARRTAP